MPWQRGRSVMPFLFAATCALVLLAASCKSKEAQKQVVLYCSVDQDVAEPIILDFEEMTGVKVLARYDTEASKTVGLIQRLRAEGSAPVADVFWSNEIFHTIGLAREGVLAPYVSDKGPSASPSGALGAWPQRYADAQSRWYGFALRARVLAWSTRRVRPEEAPRRLEDLLEAKWKGRIVMAWPQFGTTGGEVASWFAHYGPVKARAILEGLKANAVRMVEGNSTAVRMVATGQADVAMTDTDDVYAAQRNGWPVAMSYLDQGGDGVLTIPNTVGIVKGGPNPAQARQLVDFLLSEKVERTLARSDSHNTPIRPALAAEFAGYAIPKPLALDYEKIADQLSVAIQAAGEILK